MDAEITAVRFLGWALLALIVGIVLCFLAVIGYNTYIQYQDKHKKIEVRTQNSNFKKSRHE